MLWTGSPSPSVSWNTLTLRFMRVKRLRKCPKGAGRSVPTTDTYAQLMQEGCVYGLEDTLGKNRAELTFCG